MNISIKLYLYAILILITPLTRVRLGNFQTETTRICDITSTPAGGYFLFCVVSTRSQVSFVVIIKRMWTSLNKQKIYNIKSDCYVHTEWFGLKFHLTSIWKYVILNIIYPRCPMCYTNDEGDERKTIRDEKTKNIYRFHDIYKFIFGQFNS